MVNTIPFSHQTIQSPGRGGGTLIFSHIRRLGLFLGVRNSEFQLFLGFSEKWPSFRVISMQFRAFFKVKVQNWDIFLGC